MEDDKHEVTFQDLTTLFFLAPAILHVNDFYLEDLQEGRLQDVHPELWCILEQAEILEKGKLTRLGNVIFSCVDLVRYYMVTGMEMAYTKKPEKKVWQYELLRKGLGSYANVLGIDYIDFLNDYVKQSVTTCLDLGGGSGHYLELVGERYNVDRCILLDKDIDVAFEHFDMNYPNSNRYMCKQMDISETLDISPYKADLVLLNEVFHLRGEKWWTKLMDNALANTHPKGQICIGEVEPNPAFDWRMKAYTDEGYSISMNNFMYWINQNYKGVFEEAFGVLGVPTHWFVILTKKEHNHA